MKKTLCVSLFLGLLLSCIGFSRSVFAQQTYTLDAVSHIYRVEDRIDLLPFLAQRNVQLDSLIDFFPFSFSGYHGVANETPYTVASSWASYLFSESTDFASFYQDIRMSFIQKLLDTSYTDFHVKPYGKAGDYALTVSSGDFTVVKNIEQKDGLDALLQEKLSLIEKEYATLKKYNPYLIFKDITLSEEEFASLGTLYLFQNEEDLRDLGYDVVSWRIRTSTDKDYRRHNIKTAFKNMGNVRILLPDQTFNLAQEFHYSPYVNNGREMFVSGYAIMGNGEQLVYGGGLCGVGTAFYQGTLSNLGLAIVEAKAHSIYYQSLFNAQINGEDITTPGLDATIFTPNFDVKIKNIREYPIIFIFNFDGEKGHEEQMFSLSKTQDKGSFEYIGSYKKKGLTCYTRNIRGEEKTTCYRQIKK